jgi:hypothetical protein
MIASIPPLLCTRSKAWTHNNWYVNVLMYRREEENENWKFVLLVYASRFFSLNSSTTTENLSWEDVKLIHSRGRNVLQVAETNVESGCQQSTF